MKILQRVHGEMSISYERKKNHSTKSIFLGVGVGGGGGSWNVWWGSSPPPPPHWISIHHCRYIECLEKFCLKQEAHSKKWLSFQACALPEDALSAQEKYIVSKNCDTVCIFWEFPSGAQGIVVVYKHVHHCAQGFVAVYNLLYLAVLVNKLLW